MHKNVYHRVGTLFATIQHNNAKANTASLQSQPGRGNRTGGPQGPRPPLFTEGAGPHLPFDFCNKINIRSIEKVNRLMKKFSIVF